MYNLRFMTPNEIRGKLGLPPLTEIRYSDRTYNTNKPINCKNCGAPLNDKSHCEYCGTRY